MKRITFEIDQEKVLGLLGTFPNIREELRSLIMIAVLHNPSYGELDSLRVAGIEVVPEPKPCVTCGCPLEAGVDQCPACVRFGFKPKPVDEHRTEPSVGYQCKRCGQIAKTVPCGCHKFQMLLDWISNHK